MKLNKQYNQYIRRLKTRNKKIISALTYALEKHSNQFRRSGEPYIEHCMAVYKILKSWGVENEDLLIASFLHDVVEDTDTTINTIKKLYGSNVAFLVDSVTKFKLGQKIDRKLKTVQKVIKGSFIDPKVSILKLADRYHNLSTLEFMPINRRDEKAKESLEIFAKLAESLGLWIVKTEIEDLSFKNLYIDKFNKVKTIIDQDERLSEKVTIEMLSVLKSVTLKSKINSKIRLKKSGYYHAYQKLKQYSVRGITSNENYKNINDIVSYRIIVKSTENCYKLLYFIHKEFGSSVDYTRFDEFIGDNKRINGYEALQTTLNTKYGSVEIAIMTEDMENFNNWGFVYNLNKGLDSRNYNLKLVFTPEYDLVLLPEDAKAIDFAYAVNTKLGDNSTKVSINGKTRNLDHKLNNTDVVRVSTGDRSTEEDLYLASVSLPITKYYLEKKIVETEKINSIQKGKEILEDRLSKRGILDLNDINQDIFKIAYSLGCQNVEEIYYRAAKGYLNLDKLDTLLDQSNITKEKLGWTTIQTGGIDKPGLLKLITDCITKDGGNIVRITFHKDNYGNNFYLRVVAENINAEDIETLRAEILKEKSFKMLRVV